jgi:hypothetical protein
MPQLKKVSFGIAAAITILAPALAFARKRFKAAAEIKRLLDARLEGRKHAHAPKPRKARRLARHLAKRLAESKEPRSEKTDHAHA